MAGGVYLLFIFTGYTAHSAYNGWTGRAREGTMVTTPIPQHKNTSPPAKTTRIPLVVVAGITIAAAIVVGIRMAQHEDVPQPFEVLIEQIHQAADGTVTSPHVFGGELIVEHGEGSFNVTARTIPPKACVQAGWQLVREGTLIVNGILPKRVSAARLSELCSMTPEGATLTWAPEP
jgi:hypothetical protein